MEVELHELPEHGGYTTIFSNYLTGEWFLRIVGANNEIIATTEGHKNRIDLVHLRDRYFHNWDIKDNVEGGESDTPSSDS